ncbi:uncharacterized protein F4807DRAFT_423339 [Annulohypoxylon truncatum]|uniref:uncharacterized protein n=1 Tax=Annulohypoxylon truncatum TaxID=327061 RepID=UPI002008C703|nr:uncharacterized protein F4807DRAFT_423339 [Annulohypoxylon truncatum]KAI1210413.1 hypothetical protein F4807DRAFT_423339 [Annulohypoxylon truncatum]
MEPSNPSQPMILPLMDGGEGYTFSNFLGGDDAEYPAINEAAGSASALSEDLGVTNAPSPAAALATGNSLQKQRLERRGHTKSRRGCFNCKRRRIKCQETRPACGHCVKTGLKCEYPVAPLVVHQPQHQIPLFSLQDMRFFQHFLFTCFPNHPLGNESIWTHEIPCLSQTYEYLMHAILGLAASDLMQQDPSLVTFAMMHRLKAIKAIKKTLNEAPKSNTFEEGNALVATCFALTFQSVILDDGMAEFMTFVRGVVLVAMQMWAKNARPLFTNLHQSDPQKILKPIIEAIPPIRSSFAASASASIRALEPLCRRSPITTSSSSNDNDDDNDNDDLERTYQQYLLGIADALPTSSYQAYLILCRHYAWWIGLPHERFRRLIDPSSQVFALLSAHWVALKQIMAPITEAEASLRAREPRGGRGVDLGTSRWLKHLNRQVDAEHRRYNDWPVWVEEQLDRDMTFFGKRTVSLLT